MISIIIPTRNRYKYVHDLIADLKNQTLKDIEIIVVDQSTKKEPIAGVTQIFDEGTGPCRSRNIGARKAQGDILVFLDDDARVEVDFIEEMVKPIRDGKFVACAGANCDPEGNYLYEDGEFLVKNDYNFIKSLTRNPNAPTSRITLSFPGCCSAVKKDVFMDVGGYDERFDPTGAGEDREMGIKLFKNGYGIWYNADAKFLHFGAKKGGSRDVGSRSLMLDINSLRICKNHFSYELSTTLAQQILSRYRKDFYKTFRRMKLIRTKYILYKTAKKEILTILHDKAEERRKYN